MTDGLWHPRANNGHYRIRGLRLPAGSSTGAVWLESTVTIMPDQSGRIRIKSGLQERDKEIVAGQPLSLQGGGDVEIINTSDQELSLTVVELKEGE